VLRALHISGLGVIDDLDLEFGPGLNVLSGETGAGKTMVTVGLELALGGRGSAGLVREGSGAARVQALFEGAIPQAAVDLVDDQQLLLGRTIGADGRSTARIGDQLVTVAALARLAPDLVELQGQHRGQRLLRPGAQTAFLDRSVGPDHASTVRRLGAHLRALADLRERMRELATRSRDREREIDLLAYQVREIEQVDPHPGELSELESQEARLGHAERLAELGSAAAGRLAEEAGGADALRAAGADLSAAADIDPAARDLAARARGLGDEAAELAREAREYAERLAPDPARLEEVRDRAQALRELRRKYGADEEEVLGFLADSRERLEALAGLDDERAALEARARDEDQEVASLAALVRAARTDAAPRLRDALQDELAALGMADVLIEVVLEPLAEPGPDGSERVELRFSGGSGQTLQPLSKTASGGELSRVMLACRSVLADLDEVPTLVFDEVDAGIGGRAGVAVGRRLARLAEARQVLVVTHLPQIASFADRHFHVEKENGAARVLLLDPEARIEELSRMLSGLPGSESALAHAGELLAEAELAKAERPAP
jgi:DNA repair protein RecN (Recombination protein N)